MISIPIETARIAKKVPGRHLRENVLASPETCHILRRFHIQILNQDGIGCGYATGCVAPQAAAAILLFRTAARPLVCLATRRVDEILLRLGEGV